MNNPAVKVGQIWRYKVNSHKYLIKSIDGKYCALKNITRTDNKANQHYEVDKFIPSQWKLVKDTGPVEKYTTVLCNNNCGASFVLEPGEEYIATCPLCRK